MKLKLTLDQFFDLVEIKFFDKVQGNILFNSFMTNKKNQLPYVTKTQLKTLRKMGCVKIE